MRLLRALAVVAALLGSASAIQAQTTVITLAWDANTESDLAGYEVSYGTLSGVYSTVLDVGNVTSVPFTLPSGIAYYFAVKAYNSANPRQYSPYSVEVSTPGPPTAIVKATPVVTWVDPAAITYGTALGAAQLNATANVAGSFAYSPAAGTVLNSGARTLSVTFSPADTVNYTTATRTVTISVARATPVVTWANPAAITYGTALGPVQLNATANAPGSYVYTPAPWTILPVGTQALSVVFTPADAANYTTASARTVLTVLPKPSMTTTPQALRFAAAKTAGSSALTAATPAQTVTVIFAGASGAWTASAPQSWLQVTGGSGTGSGQFAVAIVNPGNVIGGNSSLSGAILITSPTSSSSPLSIPVSLSVDQTGGAATRPPVGLVDSPAQGATGIAGAIGVTGWVVDDVGVRSVKIYRNCLAFEPAINCTIVGGINVVPIGEATLVAGARPDIEAQYASYPQAYQSAWGYSLLTNMMPHVPNRQMFGGQGPLTLYVLAEDVEGHQRWLGRNFVSYPGETDQVPTTFTMANDTIAKPFGVIDTPSHGQTVSGSFWNFGWTLAPDSNATADAGDILMPLDGTTQWVYVDGIPLGPVTAYNMCRGTVGSPVPAGVYCDDDVASIFGNIAPLPTHTPRAGNPTRHRNLDAGRGAIAGYYLDTTTLSNGVHTIVWGVTDSAGRGEGIGSRYFTVLNSGTAAARSAGSDSPVGGDSPVGARHAVPVGADSPEGAPLTAPDAAVQPAAARGDASSFGTVASSTGPVWGRSGFDVAAPLEEIAADDAGVRRVQITDLGRLELWLGRVEQAYLMANGTRRDLPPGSRLNPETGQFTWAPALGYLGTYRLVFVRGSDEILVDVTIRPMPAAEANERDVRMAVDTPLAGETVSGAITVAGWALDPRAWTGSGIDAVHVWAQRTDVPSAAPEFLGAAALGGARPDVAQVYGSTFGATGFGLTTDALASGTYDLTIFVWNRRTARWEDARTVRVTARAGR